MSKLPAMLLVLLIAPAAAAASYTGAGKAAAEEEPDPFLRPAERTPELDQEAEAIRARQARLRWHQGLGLSTIGLVTAQAALGQSLLNRQDRAIFDSTTDNLRTAHLAAGIAATVTYAGAASLAFTAPKIEETGSAGSLRAHRALAWFHGAGMLLTPTLGFYMRNQAENMDADHLRTLKTIHQVSGYTTLAALYGAALVIVWD